MNLFAFITWDVSPIIVDLKFIQLRWYGFLFASGFVIGQYIMSWIFKMEKRPQKELDGLLIYMLVSTVIGARLGHCLFYEPAYYLSHPIDILKVWEGGLASHGATVTILFGVWLFAYRRNEVAVFFHKVTVIINNFISNKKPDEPIKSTEKFTWFYLLDRLVIVAAPSAGLIRLGNLMNSEIVGLPTNQPWGFVFMRNLTAQGLPEDFARHPSQLYESIFYFALFAFLLVMYLFMKEKTPHGRLLGWFLFLVFLQRILIEFTKENQVAFENTLPLNMGQILSIPLVLIGLFVLIRSYIKPINI